MTKRQNGCNVNTQIDPTHCGGCTSSCSTNHVSTPTCYQGSCNGTCDAGWADCNNDELTDGCETNVSSDPSNCGRCRLVCSTGMGCVNGVCGCPVAGQSFCGGTCVDTQTNVNDCG